MHCNSASQENRQILTQANWESMYSKTSYKDKTEHAQKHTLHYLLAFNQSDSTILPYIERHKDKEISILKIADKKNSNLTPLLIATMKGRFKVVQVLFATCKYEGKALSEERDGNSWTVLHHAIVVSKEIYDFLVMHGANTNVINSLCGTPDDVRSLVDYEVKPVSIHRMFYQSDSGKLIPISEMGKNTMMELISLKEYRDSPYFPQNAMKELWQLQGNGKTLAAKFFKEYLDNPPLLIIQPCKELIGKTKHPLELCAGEDLKFGAIISEYSGIVNDRQDIAKSFQQRFDPERVNANEYRYKNIDATEVGNASRFANWGWPNVVVAELKDRGSPRKMLVVIDPAGIKKGEPIHVLYGITYTHLAFGAQTLLGRTKMREYFAKCNLYGRISEFKQAEAVISTFHEAMKVDAIRCYIEFPLDTPSAFLDLHFSGRVTADEWIEQWITKEEDIILDWAKENPGLWNRVQSMMFRVAEFEFALSGHTELRKKFGEWVLSRIGDLSVMQILKAMDNMLIFRHIENNKTSTEEFWIETKNFLERDIAQYDWTKDENAPIGQKRSMEDQIDLFQAFIKNGRRSEDGVLNTFLAGLVYYSKIPEKEKYENYQNILKLAEGLGLKEKLLKLYEDLGN